jgi:hypothetical protein
MARRQKHRHNDKVNKLFTILVLALLPYPAFAASTALPATVSILRPTADVELTLPHPKARRVDLTLRGFAGQVIRYQAGDISRLIVLDANGVGVLRLPNTKAAQAEYVLYYD